MRDKDAVKNVLDNTPELPPRKVLLTRKAYLPWLAAAWAAAPVTFIVLLIYSTTTLPDQWGFHFGAWAKKGPLRLPAVGSGLLWFVLAKVVYRIPIGNPKRERLPEVLAYYPRTLWEIVRTSLALFHAVILSVMLYLCQLLIFVEVVGILAK